jgi:hypothetical protein
MVIVFLQERTCVLEIQYRDAQHLSPYHFRQPAVIMCTYSPLRGSRWILPVPFDGLLNAALGA